MAALIKEDIYLVPKYSLVISLILDQDRNFFSLAQCKSFDICHLLGTDSWASYKVIRFTNSGSGISEYSDAFLKAQKTCGSGTGFDKIKKCEEKSNFSLI
jgi:hypothetical protein